MLVLRGSEGSLRFLVHPELRTTIQGEDLTYLEELLQDFRERSKLHPTELFEQISSLAVGPLVTQMNGSNLSEHLSIQKLSLRFVELR